MSDRIVAALIIAGALIVAGLAAGGRYSIAGTDKFSAFVVDRHAGTV